MTTPAHSINAWLRRLAANHTPRYRCTATSSEEWAKWRDALRPELLATLGPMPQPTPLGPELVAEWNADGLIKQKWIIQVESGLHASVYIFRPADANEPLPAILCCHGHGDMGKEPMMGFRATEEMATNIRLHNYDYGLQMAQAGFVTAAIDWRGFGDRDDRRKPHYHDITHGRDLCNIHFIRVLILGQTLLGLNIYDGQRTLDLLCQQPYVDATRIGTMGLSLGGTLTTWLAICDDRIKAANVIGYSDRFADFGIRDANFCGSQITPGLFELCDVPDLQGLIAPRPLLVEIAVQDHCFHVESALSCYRAVERIYEAANASDNLELDLFEGGHVWGGNKSVAFFQKALAHG